MTLSKKKLNVPIYKLIPSIITIVALCLGITSIRYSLDGKFNIAVALISIAAFLDGIDGRIARLLNSSTQFGAQLDSFADLCSFGVAPGVSVYLWILRDIPYKGVGWSIVLFYIVCSSLRLSRFHIQLIDNKKDREIEKDFFIGIPMPVAASVLLTPMMFSFEMIQNNFIIFSYWFNAFYMILIGFLMISKVPIYSAKRISVPKEKVNIILVMSSIIFTGIVFEPWILLPIFGLLYILIVPLGSVYYQNIRCKKRKFEHDADIMIVISIFIYSNL